MPDRRRHRTEAAVEQAVGPGRTDRAAGGRRAAAHRRRRRPRPGRPRHRRTPRHRRAARLAPPPGRRAAASGCPRRVLVENETNLAALAEQRDGAARDRDTFVLLWLGHGIGAAVVLDGTLRRGASGGTGEIGFLPVPGTAALPSGDRLRGRFPLPGRLRRDLRTGGAHGTRGLAGPAEPQRAAAARRSCARRRGRVAGDAGAALPRRARRTARPRRRGRRAPCSTPAASSSAGEVGSAGGEGSPAGSQERLRPMSPLPHRGAGGRAGRRAVLRGALLAARDAAQDELFAPGG